MGLFKYLGSLVKNDTGNSSKSFALVMQTLSSFFMTLLIGFILAYDVYSNGYIKTDLEMLGVFMFCIYTGVPSSGIPKIFGERNRSGKKYEEENKTNEGE